jgi:LysR family hydrogen peroxide-inducible transcriptional activator
LLEDGHCLRDQALDVCRLSGASEKTEFQATSLETLRQMVAAGVGVTLLPTLAVKPPVARSGDIRLLPFDDAQPPSRRIGMAWRRSSARADILQRLAGVFRGLPPALLAPPPAAVEQDAANR